MNQEKRVILAINPGSTSIKITLYRNQKCIVKKNLQMNLMEIVDNFENYDLNRDSPPVQLVLDCLREQSIAEEELGIVVSRGGPAPPMQSGAYEINELYLYTFRYEPLVIHPAILGPGIAYSIAKQLGIPAIVYDSDSVDEADEMEHLTGLPELRRTVTSHNLNGRMRSIALAEHLGKPYEECRFVVTHLGGGISVCAHREGRVVDSVFIDEGPMTPTRTGNLPTRLLIDLCYSGKYSYKEMCQFIISRGGLMAYFGTNDAMKVEEMVMAGDEKATLVYQAMAYQTAKCIGQMAIALSGDVDALLFTGGMAHSDLLIDWIKEWVGFLGPVYVHPGEDEMKALAEGGYRVLCGQEGIRKYDIPPMGFSSIEEFYKKYNIPFEE